MIPRVIHFIWIGDQALPAYARRNIARFRLLNPDYDIVVHDERGLLPELREAYDRAPALCSKADLLRYSILSREGGWYFDCDFWPVRPVDDAVSAWDLDGSRVFISRQQGHRSGNRMPYNNAPLAGVAGHEAFRLIIRECQQVIPDGRLTYGPAMIKSVVDNNGPLFEVAEAGWFFPVPIRQAAEAYHVLMHAPERIDIRSSGTAGQLPIAVHLWADAVDLEAEVSRPFDDRPVAAVHDYRNPRQFMHSVAIGLERLGYAVRRFEDPKEIAEMVRKPEVVAGWNGVRDERWWKAAEDCGAVHLASEHGFFDRNNYFQLDHKGFLHRSTIADDLRRRLPPPADADARVAVHVPHRKPVTARDSGYVLILGQVNGDTQLVDSEVKGHAPLLRMLSRSLPQDLKAIYRPHPQMAKKHLNEARRYRAVEMQDIDPNAEHAAYNSSKQGSTLQSALAGARFCVAINSNALIEALVAGVPCAAFGPALGIDAGALYHVPFGTRGIERMYADMLGGWTPDDADVLRLLRTLCCRQYTREEIAAGPALARILRRGGAVIPNAVQAADVQTQEVLV